MVDLPQFKKKISAFIQDEKGAMPKQSLLSLGTILTTTTFLGLMADEAGAWHSSHSGCSGHKNNMHVEYDPATATVTATHKHWDAAHSSS